MEVNSDWIGKKNKKSNLLGDLVGNLSPLMVVAANEKKV